MPRRAIYQPKRVSKKLPPVGDPNPKPTQNSKFTLFSQLPAETRLQIWRTALLQATIDRTIHVEVYSQIQTTAHACFCSTGVFCGQHGNCPAFREGLPHWSPFCMSDGFFASTDQVPSPEDSESSLAMASISLTCRESRMAVLELYPKFLRVYQGPWHPGAKSRLVRCCPETDLLVVYAVPDVSLSHTHYESLLSEEHWRLRNESQMARFPYSNEEFAVFKDLISCFQSVAIFSRLCGGGEVFPQGSSSQSYTSFSGEIPGVDLFNSHDMTALLQYFTSLRHVYYWLDPVCYANAWDDAIRVNNAEDLRKDEEPDVEHLRNSARSFIGIRLNESDAFVLRLGCDYEIEGLRLPKQLVCASFSNHLVSSRPTDKHFRVLLFPVDGKPEVIWHGSKSLDGGQEDGGRQLLDIKLILGPDAPLKITPIQYNARLKRKLVDTIYICYRDTFLIDGSRPNQSIARVVSTQAGQYYDWRGPVLVYGMTGLHVDQGKYRDLDMDDFRHVFDYLLSYNYKPAATTKTINAVRINCLGDQKMCNKPAFESVEILSTDPIFSSHDTSDIARRIGLPIFTHRLPPNPAWANDDVGSVLVVRQDMKPLHPLHVEALCKYCQDDIGLLLAHSLGDYEPEKPMEKEAVLAMICRPTFVISWYKLLDEKLSTGNEADAPYPYDA
ncbi:hypothetical protein ACQKWADRAFT_322548 [Trichoderma austrokoningii]